MPLFIALVSAPGAVIHVGPGDNYTKIEAAQPGDEVVIAPGTYAFRVYLTGQGSATNPIVIRAQDPANRPVWDFGTTLVENAPGSYTAGDRGRGGWQFSRAKNYCVSGIVFRNCHTASMNSAGIRYYNGTTNLYVKDCLFTANDNGITGGTQESQATVEYCEFATNGNLSATSPTHNLYIYGGTFALRYCYVHDSLQAQNFHIRARSATLEYNWFARATSYEGDLMTDDDFAGAGPFSQAMTLRGNVFVQAAAPDNHSQVFVLFNDGGLTNLTMSARVLYNTFVGNGGSAAFVHLSNATGTPMSAEESDNVVYGTTEPMLVENSSAGVVSGVNNWLQTNANPGTLSGSLQSAAPGFRNAAAEDYTLGPGSACIGAANASLFGLPGKEYYLNETNHSRWRPRAAARDLGAFESTSASAPVGSYDPYPQPVLNISRAGANVILEWPLFASDFQLQQAAAIPVTAWSAVALPLSTNAAQVSASGPAWGTKEVFRLARLHL
ncbi:MAG TPA: hypothetical protein VG167_23080 [Verrucomicrobiae bacterium]|nr:hypothetical protein [Verrucomicrobiae bacterium]